MMRRQDVLVRLRDCLQRDLVARAPTCEAESVPLSGLGDCQS